MQKGFVKIPRSLLRDPNWKALKLKYRHIFLVLLENAAYKKTPFKIAENYLVIHEGQICISMRGLVTLCNRYITCKEDQVTKRIVERATERLLKIQFIRKETIHNRIIFTISYPEIFLSFLKRKHKGGHFSDSSYGDTLHSEEKGTVLYEETKGGHFHSVKKGGHFSDSLNTENKYLTEGREKRGGHFEKNNKKNIQELSEKNEKRGHFSDSLNTENKYLTEGREKSIVHFSEQNKCVKKGGHFSDSLNTENKYLTEGREKRGGHKRRTKEIKETIYTNGDTTSKGDNFDSSLLEKKYEILNSLWGTAVESKISKSDSRQNGITHQDLLTWLKKHKPDEILSCLKRVENVQINKTYAGYITSLLKNGVVKKEIDAKEGRQIVEDFIRKNATRHIVLHKQYFVDTTSNNEQIYYWSSKEIINHVLENSFQRFIEYAEDG